MRLDTPTEKALEESASSCESDFPKSSPWHFHMMAISFGCKDQSDVMFSLVT